uniref:SH2B adaptor protein 3 n=1 Tax=Poecilia formosa TaxID=48698 RepID=A0A096LQQ2_POEFO
MNGNTIHPANTTSAGGGPSVAAPPRGWREFCELHAIATARQLAGHYRSFASERPQHELVPPETFSKHFTDLFQQHFCQEVDKDGASGSASATAPSPHALDYREAKRSSGGAASISTVPKVEPVVSHSNDEISAADRHQPSERHSSDSLVPGSGGHGDITHFPVSQIQKTVQWIFQKRQSRSSNFEATAPATLHRPRVVSHLLEGFRWLRSRSMRLRRLDVSGCCKEGQLKYLLVDDTISDSQPNWQRCRLLVRRIRDTQSGGGRAGSERYQLELYDPPK